MRSLPQAPANNTCTRPPCGLLQLQEPGWHYRPPERAKTHLSDRNNSIAAMITIPSYAQRLTVLLTYSNTRLGVLLSVSRTTSSSLIMFGPFDRFCTQHTQHNHMFHGQTCSVVTVTSKHPICMPMHQALQLRVLLEECVQLLHRRGPSIARRWGLRPVQGARQL